jgi:2-oxoglutarate/2-oxoacid ferredoxin oxidoreductase subunit alpha
VRAAREKGIKVGLLRPITLAPFPKEMLEDLTEKVEGFLVVEMNAGQMLEDVGWLCAAASQLSFSGVWAVWCPSRTRC